MPLQPVRWRAASAVDGDTVRLDNGDSVRVVGIDTPEAGACGYQQASAATAALVAGGVVLRRAKGENRDRYGRLLRYVTTRAGDLGTILLRRGLAIARYDSADGYGWHPLERRYHQIDANVPQKCEVAPGHTGARVTSAKCDPAYTGTCVPPSTTDLDCADIDGSVEIVGTDRHRFDGDGDGSGCE